MGLSVGMPVQLCDDPDGSPTVLHYACGELAESEVRDDLMHRLNEIYNAKQGKAWGLFHPAQTDRQKGHAYKVNCGAVFEIAEQFRIRLTQKKPCKPLK